LGVGGLGEEWGERGRRGEAPTAKEGRNEKKQT
jgi:hypothetical protein